MPDDPRVDLLLEEILESGCTPEEACRDCPGLLSRVKARLRRIRAVDAQFDSLFPTPGSSPATAVPTEAGRPHFPGFEVRELLGRGGMGVVYRAWDRRLNRDVAIKMLIAGAHARPEELERFLRGAAAEAGLRHPNIVPIYEIRDADGRPYFTMEFVEGGSLAQRLAGRPLPPGEAATLVATLADAVQAAHDGGVVHRDLKPANVLLTADGTPKVTDFGLARRLDSGAGLTQSGDALGTPSYMAPEQALGRSGTVGPVTDVYALGAILYEALTGRPPFRAPTAAETTRQVIDDEPVPPSRLNALVSRDLEIICLKCLSKEPPARYPSAAALADDLRRFRRGEAITARTPSPTERAARWLRRRWDRVAIVAVGLAMAIGLVGAGLWLWSEERAIEQGVQNDLREAVRWQQATNWSSAAIALERARGRLGQRGPAALRRRLDKAGRGLDQARREHTLATQVEPIRLARMTLVEGRHNPGAERRFNDARADRAYETAFREAHVGTPGDDPKDVGARAAASSMREPLLEALGDWAVCAADDRRRAWVLAVARRADPDGWRDRARDPAAWGDRTALDRLVRSAPLAAQPASLLAALGERLHALGGDGAPFLARVHRVYPSDFWVALALARALQEGTDPDAAVAPYRRALELRGDTAVVYSNLALIPYARRRWDEASGYCQKALEIDPKFAPALNHLGLAQKGEGAWPEAGSRFREAVRLDPGLAPAHYNLGEIRAFSGGAAEAIDHYRRALQIDPAFARAEYLLGVALVARGRTDEVSERHEKALRNNPGRARAYAVIFGVALDEGFEQYKHGLYIDAAFSASHNRLGLTPRDTARLNEAIGHYERALRENAGVDPWLERVHAALGQAFLELGRFGEAEAATRRALSRMSSNDDIRANVEAQLRRCRRLVALRDRLPAVLQGTDRPRDTAESLEFAELCGMQGQFSAAAHLYSDAFTASPPPAEDLRTTHRYTAACAAALAGYGRGEDGATLGEADRARWRGRAREWLRVDLTVWARTLENGPRADGLLVLGRLAHLWTDPDLAGLFDDDQLDTLPPAEREECRTLWEEVDALIQRAQVLKAAGG